MLKGGQIGLGRMGLTHYSILNNHPGVKFLAVCDSSAFLLKNFSRYCGLDTYDDYRKMLDKVKLDFVIISTPTGAHACAVRAAIERNVHVFVEKPFALNPQQGGEVMAALEGHKLVNQVGYVVRFNDVFLKVRQLLQASVIGELLTYKMEMYGPTILKDAHSGWRAKKTEGGGCLYDFASHPVDLTNYLFGPPQRVTGSVLQRIHSASVEDAVSTTLLYANGLRGNLLANWSDPSYRKPAYRLEVLGRKGKILADLHEYKVFFREKPEIDGFTDGWNHRYVTDFVEPVRFYVRGYEFTRQLDCFIDCILGRRTENLCTFADGLATDVIIDSIRRDAAGEQVRVAACDRAAPRRTGMLGWLGNIFAGGQAIQDSCAGEAGTLECPGVTSAGLAQDQPQISEAVAGIAAKEAENARG